MKIELTTDGVVRVAKSIGGRGARYNAAMAVRSENRQDRQLRQIDQLGARLRHPTSQDSSHAVPIDAA